MIQDVEPMPALDALVEETDERTRHYPPPLPDLVWALKAILVTMTVLDGLERDLSYGTEQALREFLHLMRYAQVNLDFLSDHCAAAIDAARPDGRYV
jgi:hypothetical protein